MKKVSAKNYLSDQSNPRGSDLHNLTYFEIQLKIGHLFSTNLAKFEF